MTAREKAQELIEKFSFVHTEDGLGVLDRDLTNNDRKQCALIAVDEIIESHLVLSTTHDLKPSIRCKRYWQEVKQEIINL